MYLAQEVEYSVQTGWGPRIPFEWLFPLTGFRASESGIDWRVFGVVAIVATLVSIASWLAVAIPSV